MNHTSDFRHRFPLPQSLFLGIMAAGILVFLAAIPASQGAVLVNLLHQDPQDAFMDFFNNLSHSPDDYLLGASYPPLACLLNGLFSLCIPASLREAYAAGDHYVIRDSQVGIMFYLLVLVGVLLAFSFFFKGAVRGPAIRRELALWCVLFSTPFVFSYERANLILLAMVFAMAFLWGYDHPNCWVRRFAFLALTIAAAIKIYPAVLGLVLVRERRWKDTALLTGTGLAVFLLPFLAFRGGFVNLFRMLQNLTRTTGTMQFLSYGLKHDLANFLGILSTLIGLPLGRLTVPLQGLLLLWVTALVVFHPRMPRWRAVTLLASLMILIPGFSYTYALIFMALPLALFLREAGTSGSGRADCLYALCFAGLFLPLAMPEQVDILGNTQRYLLTPVTMLENVALLALVGGILLQETGAGIQAVLSKRRKQS